MPFLHKLRELLLEIFEFLAAFLFLVKECADRLGVSDDNTWLRLLDGTLLSGNIVPVYIREELVILDFLSVRGSAAQSLLRVTVEKR